MRPGASGVPPEAAVALRWAVGLVIAILVLLWLARAVFRYERRLAAVDAEEFHESVWSWKDLRALWQARWRTRRRARLVPRSGSGNDGAAAIRRAYAQFLGSRPHWDAGGGRAIPPPSSRGPWPPSAPKTGNEVRRLTVLYTRVRYGLAYPRTTRSRRPRPP